MKEIKEYNPNSRRIIECPKCKKVTEHHGKGLCFNCYRKYAWVKKNIICKHCGRERPHKAKGMCDSCHVKVYHYDRIKNHNYKKVHNISPELYKKVTQQCIVCGFDKAVDLHHLDKNRKNNSEKNLIGLCPNHHKMIHNYKYSQEVVDVLKNLGYDPKITKF